VYSFFCESVLVMRIGSEVGGRGNRRAEGRGDSCEKQGHWA
jgi:hypothetical protein